MSQIAIHHPLCPRGRTKRSILGIGSCNAGDQPIGLAEIKTRIKTERHDGCGRSRSAYAGEHSHDTLIVHAQIVVALRKGINVAQVFAFYPVLVLAGRIALIRSWFVERNDHDLHWDGRRRGHTSAGRQNQDEQRQQSSAHTGA